MRCGDKHMTEQTSTCFFTHLAILYNRKVQVVAKIYCKGPQYGNQT